MNKDFSLLDANLARVKEGLRVLEDIVRFVFADKELFEALKILRHSLSQTEAWFGSSHFVRGRSGPDVGSEPLTKSEQDRSSLYSVIRANSNRVTEALRSLEEFSKIYTNQNAFLFQKARYQVYALERDLIMRTPHYYFSLAFEEGVVYPISDSLDSIKDYIDAGARVVQLRDKNATKELFYQKTKELCRFLQKRYAAGKEKVTLIVNDHVDIAARLPVDGVHLGQEDEKTNRARFLLGSNKVIGRSVQTLEQALQAVSEGVDYIGIGPVFLTPNKAEKKAVGLEILDQMSTTISIPWCAIGGITLENAKEVTEHGAKNIAVIRSAKQFFEKGN